MRKEIVFIFALILISGLVVADSPLPVLPASYFGKITVNNEPIADGYFVTGKINGVVLDSCRTSGGLYGSGKDTLIVTSGNPNAIVEFYIGNVKIGEHVFEGMEVIEVDFDLNETPEYPGMPVDGVCDVEGGECLYNSEDCNPSKTDACSNNGRCDTEIGETCSNTPEDCGSCPSEETSDGGSSGGGGGGGGGSSSSSNTVTLSTSNEGASTDSTDADLSGLETTSGNEEDGKTTEGKGITGKTIEGITTFAKSGYGIGIGVFLILLAAFLLVRPEKRLKKKQAKKKGKKS